MNLAVVYANLGRFDETKEIVHRIIELDPSLASELEGFLKRLEQ